MQKSTPNSDKDKIAENAILHTHFSTILPLPVLDKKITIILFRKVNKVTLLQTRKALKALQSI